MGQVLKLAEKLFKGDENTYEHHPFGPPHGLEQIAEGTYFYKGFANTIIRETEGGLIIVDPAANFDEQIKFDAIRSKVKQHLDTVIFTHGHVDHAFGVSQYAEEAKARGWPLPKVIAHEAMPARFQRYLESQQWNAIINLRQFRGGSGEVRFPGKYYYPDITYKDRLAISVGGVTAQLKHARGETDDHTWVFFPDNRVLCTGDLFIYAIPNAGNPQKVQRYAKEWAIALRKMAALEPEFLAPGHGFPIIGADRVRQALEDTAACLESIHEQTLTLMNSGASLDTIIHSVKVPGELLAKPYLQP
ncbi:MAG: MBL fold metallo-hydrolase, partial [Deltaproteobacteria bacterium]|nr:MBL fold metallo-hydrolase [Deltaproteobacteria bacterium]